MIKTHCALISCFAKLVIFPNFHDTLIEELLIEAFVLVEACVMTLYPVTGCYW